MRSNSNVTEQPPGGGAYAARRLPQKQKTFCICQDKSCESKKFLLPCQYLEPFSQSAPPLRRKAEQAVTLRHGLVFRLIKALQFSCQPNSSGGFAGQREKGGFHRPFRAPLPREFQSGFLNAVLAGAARESSAPLATGRFRLQRSAR